MSERVDVVVLGMGPAGEDVAGRLAEAGLTVVGVEDGLLGGKNPYRGGVPSKMMIRAGLAGSATVRPDWTPVTARIRAEATDNWGDKAAVDRFVDKGGRFVRGRGRLTGPGRVAVGDQIFEALLGVVVATGAQPAVPPIYGLAGTPFWTHREAVGAETLPSSLIVLGAGVIGLELAQVYARFGVLVDVVEAADRLLAMEEPQASTLAYNALTRDGVEVHIGRREARVEHDGTRFTLTLHDGGHLRAEALLVATGRRANLAALGVDSVGLDPAAPALAVDDRMRAGPRLWAVGDVTGKGAFTNVALYQAGIAARDILGQPGPPADYRVLPRAMFTDPEITAVGLTEAQARDRGLPVAVGVAQVPTTALGRIHQTSNDGFLKLVADTDRGVLIGATSAGPAGGEALAGLTVAVQAGVPVDTLRHMMYAYPTFHRGIEDALRDLG